MDQYQTLKRELVKIKKDVAALVIEAKSIPGVQNDVFRAWEKLFDFFEDEVSEDIVRVAVVGPIKSGKSTFVNSLYHKDYLKRGAGVVTSIVTRIRNGDNLRAILYFKSWKEINAEMEQALILFPSINWRTEKDKFDIRHRPDREELKRALSDLNSDQLITNDSLNSNSVLLQSYLDGYEQMHEFVSSENRVHAFEGEAFSEHKRFVGNDSLSVYLKDIQLEIDSDGLESPVEIADCQGSDSPNPLHLTMIQDYLQRTHFIIYVISSRTGLRQADIKFLSMIKKIGILGNTLFVVNCDISEHEAMDDLRVLVQKIKAELSLIVPEPNLFAFSALFNLFCSQDGHLASNDRDRISHWKEQKELVAFSDRETKKFVTLFYRKLAREKTVLLLRNHLERLDVVNREMNDWVRIYRDVLQSEETGRREIIKKIKPYREKIKQVEVAVKNTIDGAIPKIKNEIKRDIDRFFDVRSEITLGGVIDFVRNYALKPQQYRETLKSSGFTGTMYVVFQDFKNEIDRFMAETINPEVIRFLAEVEKRIQTSLENIASPYDLLVQDTLSEYKNTLSTGDVQNQNNRPAPVRLDNIESIKTIAGIELPPLFAAMRYSARIRSEAIFRLGFYASIRVLKKILKKPIHNDKEEEILALKDGMRRIKRETEKSITGHFKDYRENIKFQYVFKLADAMAGRLCEVILERLHIYTSDLSVIVEMINNQQIDTEITEKRLNGLDSTSSAVNDRIGMLRKKL
ncbi:dynamin family protein [Thermodesulfobacteriota bacterium]